MIANVSKYYINTINNNKNLLKKLKRESGKELLIFSHFLKIYFFQICSSKNQLKDISLTIFILAKLWNKF